MMITFTLHLIPYILFGIALRNLHHLALQMTIEMEARIDLRFVSRVRQSSEVNLT